MGLFNFFKKKNKKEEVTKPIISKNDNHTKTKQSINIKPIKTEIINTPHVPDVIPIEKRIKEMKANEAGLYPHEILLLSYASKYYIEGNSYPRFWWFQYGVKDVDDKLKSLLDRSFLKIGSLESAIEKETAVVLKDLLKANKLKVSGKKGELVRRLLDEVPEEKLKTIFTKYTYELTDSGKEILKKHEYIPYIHRHGIEDLDIFSLSEEMQKRLGYSYRDIIWGRLNKRSMIHIKNRDFGLYRNCRFSMSEFVKEEGKLENAFSLLAEVIRYDLSGLSNGFDRGFLDIYTDGYFPYKSSIATMAPGITNRVVDYKEAKGLSDDELKNKLLEYMNKIQLPFSLFTAAECADIVLMEIHKDEEGLEKLYKKAEKRFKKEYEQH